MEGYIQNVLTFQMVYVFNDFSHEKWVNPGKIAGAFVYIFPKKQSASKIHEL